MTRQIQKSKCYAGILLAAMALAVVPAARAQAVRGRGTTNTIPLWTSSSTIGNSVLTQSGGNLVTNGGITAASFTGGTLSLSGTLTGASGSFSGGITAASFNGATLSLTGALTGNSGSFSSGITAASFTGNGSGLSNVNAAALGGISASGFAQLGASNNAFSGNMSVGGTFSANTVNSGNGGFQFGGTQVLSILPGLFTLYVGQSAGQGAGSSNTGTNNTSAGYQTLFLNTTGGHNVAVGASALYSNTTGNSNTATGDFALNGNTTGFSNVAVGGNALLSNTTGADNTAVGVNTLLSIGTGSANLALGVNAGRNFTGSESNNIDIAAFGVAGESGIIRIGGAGVHTATYMAGINNSPVLGAFVTVDANTGQLGIFASSRRYKEDIHNMGDASDGLLRLRPVTFRYKKPYADGSKPMEYGLIAEEVAEVYPELVVRGKDGQVETVQYYMLDAMLLNEIQKLAKQHAADQKEISKLQEQMRQVQEQQAAMKQLQDEIRVVKLTLAQSQPADANALAGSALAPEGPKAPARK